MIRSISTLAFAIVATGARAQNMQLADNGPRFLSVPAPNAPSVDASGAPVLQRRVTLEFDRIPLEAALTEVGKQARVRLLFSTAVLSVTQPVSVHADGITVAAALTELLIGQHIDVQVSTDGAKLSLVPRDAELSRAAVLARQQGTGTITGHVTDGVLKTPLSAVSVRIEGTTLGTTANADGKYTITGLVAGTYRATARRVGYQPLTKDVTVTSDEQATLDFALTAAPTRLDEVVTTAVGQQRRYEVGNDISTINADSITPTAPITSLTDLISARAPGVTVLENSGLTGAGEAIRIEGLSSLVLQNDPILIVDGVRQDNSAGGDLGAVFQYQGTHPTPTRLNDIDFTDIQTIDILKGPAASTEYGTDAANGVIVITTKHGSVGVPQWHASAEQTESDIPESFPNNYYSWGRLTNGANTPVACPLVGGGINATYGSTSGTCITDSVTQFNPLNHAATSIFGTGNRAKYDLSVSGGSDAVRYFVSGGLSNETGVVRMPPVFKELADTAGLGLPSVALSPNGEQQRSVRVNTAIKLGPTADLTATGSYLSTYQQTPDAEQLYFGVVSAPALSSAANYYGYGGQGAAQTPLSQLAEVGSQNTDRVTGGLTANWRPASWFVGHATAGLDHGSQQNTELDYPLANAAYELFSPFLGINDATTDVYSVDVRGTVTASLMRDVRSVTSGGVQMVDNRTVGQTATASGITPTNLTLNGATTPAVTQQATRQATLGGYGEEELAVANRLFLTGALRIDAGSGFGRNYATAAYPKASVSWLAIDGGATTVRVRGAFGESGVQPTNGAALLLYTPTIANFDGSVLSVSQVNWPGNPNLRPERSAEFEGGVDVGGWGNRVSLALTGYSKTTDDALVDENLGIDLGNYTYQVNVGEVRNTGVEGSVTAAVVQNRVVTWDVAVNASMNHNKLITLAPGVITQPSVGQERFAAGYPLYGLWAQRIAYTDANHDGIVVPNGVTIADSASYIGPSLPTQEVSASTHLGLWRGALMLGGLVDYRGGYRIENGAEFNADIYVKNTPGGNEPTAPLWLQARAVATGAPFYDFTSLAIEDGSFVRVREVSVTYAVPRSLIRAVRVQNLSLTAAVRNLMLWTRYTGVDPEVVNTASGNIQSAPTTGGEMVNNDARADFGAVPLARYWVLRLNVGL